LLVVADAAIEQRPDAAGVPRHERVGLLRRHPLMIDDEFPLLDLRLAC
jgi:hypothetical protein